MGELSRMGERIDAEIAALRKRVARLESSLEECADDLAERVDAEYPDRDQYPDNMRRYRRDMQPVDTARALLGEGGEG